MIELIYISRANDRMSREQLIELLEKARAKNATLGISGLLLYDGFGTFIQTLEGEQDEVERLFAQIRVDERHSRVNMLWQSEIQVRNFADWKMGFRDLQESPPNHLEGYSEFLEQDDRSVFGRDNPGFIKDMMEYFKQKHA